jgi:tetratricopeptide (TPR) repeat protein
MLKNLSLLFLLLAIAIPSFGQYKMELIPRQSALKNLSNTIGYTEVKIQYSSPAVRDRRIWGDLVPYGEIWRAGANEATKISFSKNVVLNGNIVPAGEYALFIIPQEEEKWTVILNKVAGQWGAFKYNETEDLLRTQVSPVFNVNYQEDLKYEIHHTSFDTGIIRMIWENMELDIEFSRDIVPDLIQKIETTVEITPINENWVVYLQGAEFLVNNNKALETALQWLDLSESMFVEADENIQKKDAYYLGHIYWVYSNYYHAIGNKKQAMNYWIKMRSIDEEKGYYTKGVGPELAEEFKNEIESD